MIPIRFNAEGYEVCYCIAQGSYTELIYENGFKKLVIMNLKRVIKSLNDDVFLRCHHSYLVNIKCVVDISKENRSITLNNGVEIPVAKRRTEVFSILD